MTTHRDTGLMVISIDVELAWGRVHHGVGPGSDTLFDEERRSVAAMLDLMQRYGISATWAVVGHLFLDRCEPVSGVHHPELRRAPYSWFEGDWFADDPGTTVHRDPWWYAPDLIDVIEACPVNQEIGSHSFSHQIVGDPAYDPDIFRSELSASRDAAASVGVQLGSFVYPRNAIDHQHVLTEQGFVAYRGLTPHRFPGRSPLQRRILAAVDSVVPLASTAVRPSMEGALCNVSQTYLFDPDSRLARRLGARLWSKVITRRLSHAARNRSLFHVWFHSHDIAKAPDRALRALEHLFQATNRERKAGRLVNLTMGEVAQRMHATTVEP